MTPTQIMVNFPTFGANSTKLQPESAKYSAGFQEADVLPHEWLNWFLNKSSDGVSTLNAGLLSVEQEINSVLTAAGMSADITETDQLKDAIEYLIQLGGSSIEQITTSKILTPSKDTRAVVTVAGITVTLGNGAYTSLNVDIMGTQATTIAYTDINGNSVTDSVPANAPVKYTYNGSGWIRSCSFVSGNTLYL